MEQNTILYVKLQGKSTNADRIFAMEKILSNIELTKVISKKDKVAVKTHVGELNNTTHISPDLIKTVISKIKEIDANPFLTETSTLYTGQRSDAITHIQHAYKHGFTYQKVGAPFIMADGLLGNAEIEVEIPGILYKKVNIARDAVLADAMVILSHPTGHIVAGFGAAIKNLGMGLCSKKGKLQQHSSIKPFIKEDQCTFCGKCITWCPELAIVEKNQKAFIIEEKCVGCGECLSICKFGAVRFNWGIQSVELQKRMAEYALGAFQNKKEKSVFINVLADMTRECDCMNIRQKPVIPDIGILASCDPVAIDQATLDLTRKRNGKDIGRISFENLNPEIQLEHAEKIGLGSRKYKLIEI